MASVKKDRGGPGRGEGRGDLTPDMPRLAEPGDDQLAPRVQNERDRPLEARVEPIGERVERTGFIVKDRAAEGQRVCSHRLRG